MIIDRVPNLILKKILRSGAQSELHLVPDITSYFEVQCLFYSSREMEIVERISGFKAK